MTLALTSKTHPYKAGFAPFPGEVYRIPFAYCYRCSYNLNYPSCDLYCARHLEDTFKRVVANEEVAAVIAEPVLGEGGFVAPPPDYFKVLIDLCHKHGMLFIADEVQSGFGRTGALFASERYGIEPDIHSHCEISRRRIAACRGHRPRRNHGCSRPRRTGRNVSPAIRFPARRPSPCSIYSKVQNLLARANELGDRFQRRAREWQRRWSIVGDVRGLGGMQAIELVQSQETKVPATDETKKITQYCYEHGLITITAGSYSNVIRVLVPLVATNEQMDEGLDVLESALAAVCDKKGAVAQLV